MGTLVSAFGIPVSFYNAIVVTLKCVCVSLVFIAARNKKKESIKG